MMTKKKKRILNNIGHLAAIISDYIREPETKNTATILSDICYDIAGEKGADVMLSYAQEYAKKRKESAIKVTGDVKEMTSMDDISLANNSPT